ncbi:HAD family hydrolase [Treponema pectinovorum]|uniref:HAD family hydrolase n=1 Tax=Treponema pectinovorum TaxID=164 RepID=UPI0011CAB2B6|nr:HAD family hydrolase [Treponema pectinovorum]
MDENNKYKKTVLAICYDFDKTLSPTDMQAQGFIQSIGYDVENFWKESNKLASDNEMDQNLAWMFMMSKGSHGKFIFNKNALKEFGSKVELFPGVKTWFERINQYGENQGIKVEHYIISSGLKEMIEGTVIANEFKKIYASSFYYDNDGVAIWPAQVVNYTDKTQYLFRIKKGVLDVNDQQVNTFFKPNELRVPFRNMVYIGDSDTDIPCMKLVNTNGGHSIGVYNYETNDKTKVFKMLSENRIKYFAPADYSENSKLERLLFQIIERTKANEILENFYFECLDEKNIADKEISEEEKNKNNLINKLENSFNFRTTHSVVDELSKIDSWTENQKQRLCKIGNENSQVFSILTDLDVKEFYKKICKSCDSEYAKNIIKQIEDFY